MTTPSWQQNLSSWNMLIHHPSHNALLLPSFRVGKYVVHSIFRSI
ncbi:hypothetical protein PHLH7_08180 [Pseudomonas sp. Ost2]|nr:hypothetical protein PHLH7_08180 [Pseudomonas sp. Ost2]